MKTFTQSVVVFPRNYLTLNRINLKRAVTLLLTQKPEPINFFDDVIGEISFPSVVIQVPKGI